jgi:hypothetical protein
MVRLTHAHTRTHTHYRNDRRSRLEALLKRMNVTYERIDAVNVRNKPGMLQGCWNPEVCAGQVCMHACAYVWYACMHVYMYGMCASKCICMVCMHACVMYVFVRMTV